MEKILEVIATINSAINGVVWGWPMIILILGTGIYLTVRTKCLQVRKFGTSWGGNDYPHRQEYGQKAYEYQRRKDDFSL